MVATDLPVWQDGRVFHVGDVVRKLRKQKGWDLSDLAKATKASMTTLSEVERGLGNYRIGTLNRIAEALDVSVEDIYRMLDAERMRAAAPHDVPVAVSMTAEEIELLKYWRALPDDDRRGLLNLFRRGEERAKGQTG
jgi:transcriptional regulator with XRE-family HTH domain